MPEAIRIDLTRLTDLHSHLSVSDLEIPEGVEVLTPADTDVIQVSVPRAVAAEEEVEPRPPRVQRLPPLRPKRKAQREPSSPLFPRQSKRKPQVHGWTWGLFVRSDGPTLEAT